MQASGTSIGLRGKVDGLVALIILAIMTIGFLSIYSSEYREGSSMYINLEMNHGKQLIWVGVSLFVGIIIVLLDFRIYHTLANVIYAFTIGLLVLTLAIGKVVAGAKGWLVLGPIQIQTAEFAKLGTALALARILSIHNFNLNNLRSRLMAFGIIALPIVLVLLQNDTGSAIVFLSFFLVLYRFGLNPFYIVIPLWIGLVCLMVLVAGQVTVLITLFILGLIFYLLYKRAKFIILGLALLSGAMTFAVDFAFNKILKEYQQERIMVLLGQELDEKGAGYNVHQSLIAIGSGGLFGKGFLNGTQTKYDFVPEQSTDFIFCTVGEEFGFVGCTVLIGLFVLLLLRLIVLAEKQKFGFHRAYAYAVFGILFVHVVINISMTLGLFPVIGIPLPFVSYGGSSLLAFTILVSIFMRLDAANKSY